MNNINIFNKNEIENKLKDFKEGQDYSILRENDKKTTYNFRNMVLSEIFKRDYVTVYEAAENWDSDNYNYHREVGELRMIARPAEPRKIESSPESLSQHIAIEHPIEDEKARNGGRVEKRPNDNHSDLRKENRDLRQQLAEVKKQLAEVLEELRKLRNNSSGSDSEKLEQQIVQNEKLIKNSEAVSANEIKDQINKSQALMNEVSATGTPNKDDK
ncbi:33463_t:CDS:2, partial [Racocetra persica]